MRTIFTRVSPAAFADKVGIPAGWFVISHRLMPEKKDRRFQHGKWFKLSTREACVYRILRFSPNLRGVVTAGDPAEIVLDWPAWLDLHGRAEDVDRPLEIDIVAARWWEYPRLAVSHPDPTVRLAGAISILSFVLGVVSVILGGWSLWITYHP